MIIQHYRKAYNATFKQKLGVAKSKMADLMPLYDVIRQFSVLFHSKI